MWDRLDAQQGCRKSPRSLIAESFRGHSTPPGLCSVDYGAFCEVVFRSLRIRLFVGGFSTASTIKVTGSEPPLRLNQKIKGPGDESALTE